LVDGEAVRAIRYVASLSEVNRVVSAPEPGPLTSAVVIRDVVAVTPSAGCAGVSAFEVRVGQRPPAGRTSVRASGSPSSWETARTL
jgi:hypothetical protein